MLQCHADLCVSFQGFSPVTPLIAPCTYVHRMSLRGGQWPTWQSVSPVLPWLPLWRSCHEVTERVNIALSAPAGHLSHGERQAALIRHSYAVPPSPRGRQGERIATPVCGLVRNDSFDRGHCLAMTAYLPGYSKAKNRVPKNRDAAEICANTGNQPLTEPAVTPLMMNLLRQMYTTTTGRMASRMNMYTLPMSNLE